MYGSGAHFVSINFSKNLQIRSLLSICQSYLSWKTKIQHIIKFPLYEHVFSHKRLWILLSWLFSSNVNFEMMKRKTWWCNYYYFFRNDTVWNRVIRVSKFNFLAVRWRIRILKKCGGLNDVYICTVFANVWYYILFPQMNVYILFIFCISYIYLKYYNQFTTSPGKWCTRNVKHSTNNWFVRPCFWYIYFLKVEVCYNTFNTKNDAHKIFNVIHVTQLINLI